MKLIVITQKIDVNDDNLGFFHSWLEKFASKIEKVYAVCLSEGKHNLPDNVSVYSLGKEKAYPKIIQLFRLQKFLLAHLGDADGVFVHMCPIYAIASFPLARIFRKRMVLWYLHRSLNWKLKLAGKLTDRILTASEQSCNLKDRKKIEIVGHGIDTDFFKPSGSAPKSGFKILFVGRIAPIKDLETLVKAADILINQKNINDIKVEIIGSPAENYEKEYFEKLMKIVKDRGLEAHIKFSGGRPHKQVLEFYQNSNVLVNLSPTGGMDKAVLEAMACAVPVLLCNMSFEKDLGRFADKLIFKDSDSQDLAQKLLNLKNTDAAELGKHLREQVVKNHNLDHLTDKIINVFQE